MKPSTSKHQSATRRRTPRKNVTLDEATIAKATELGNGNLSEGLRSAVLDMPDKVYAATVARVRAWLDRMPTSMFDQKLTAFDAEGNELDDVHIRPAPFVDYEAMMAEFRTYFERHNALEITSRALGDKPAEIERDKP